MIVKNEYKYIVLDSNLSIKYADTVRHAFYPNFISDYKNGFLLMDNGIKNAWYYEIR